MFDVELSTTLFKATPLFFLSKTVLENGFYIHSDISRCAQSTTGNEKVSVTDPITE